MLLAPGSPNIRWMWKTEPVFTKVSDDWGASCTSDLIHMMQRMSWITVPI